MVYKRHHDGRRVLGNLLYAARNRNSHFTLCVCIDGETNRVCCESLLEFLGAMAEDYDYFLDSTRLQVIDACFDDRLITKSEQRLERAHSARSTGS